MRKLQVLVITSGLIFGTTSVANATTTEDSTLQTQINEVIANTQGGTQISPYEISWEGGQVIMSFPMPGESHAPTSSSSAQRLQAQVARKPTGTTETAVQPGEASTQAEDNCPTETFGNDWYCFYQNTNFGGRRLQWNATHKSPVHFSKYDFDNQTSSWSNKGGKEITVYEDFWVDNPTYLWTEYAHRSDTSVLYEYDNRADYFVTS